MREFTRQTKELTLVFLDFQRLSFISHGHDGYHRSAYVLVARSRDVSSVRPHQGRETLTPVLPTAVDC